MNCPKCSQPIPDTVLACEVCTRAGSDRALREFQHHPLRQVLEGRAKLTTRRIEHRRHVQMFGAERTCCGIELWPGHARERIAYDPIVLRGVCPDCMLRIGELIEELK